MNLRAYPLCWPEGWKRTESWRRQHGRFAKHGAPPTIGQGCERVILELERLSIKRDDLIVSTNVETRLDGLPRSDRANPSDPGVAVYWRKKPGAAMKCMAVDRYRAVADNLCAVAATLEAMRAIERHGGAEILERAFTGFAALPEKTSRAWWEVLETGPTPSREVIEANFRRLARERHPDMGGSDSLMAELNAARELALRETRSN